MFFKMYDSEKEELRNFFLHNIIFYFSLLFNQLLLYKSEIHRYVGRLLVKSAGFASDVEIELFEVCLPYLESKELPPLTGI